MSFGAILLAAGVSDRMGSSKPLLKIGETTFVEHILDQLETVPEIESTIVVLGARAQLIKDAVDFGRATAIQHRGYKEGMFSSVRAGARAVLRKAPKLEGVLVCLVDMPLVEADTYARLVQAFQPDKDDVVLAAHQGEAGHPILLCRQLVDRLGDVSLAAPAEDTLSEFIEAHAERRRYVEAHDPNVLVNINTPDAYRTFLGEDPTTLAPGT